jgi:hypothetical protein
MLLYNRGGIVDFDIDYGPKITSVYPPLELTSPEESNMSVLIGLYILFVQIALQSIFRIP